jgi:flagellin
MGLTITNNVASLNAQNNLTRSNSALSKSLERLSSGLKINRGADGPAALVISEQQRAQIAGLQTAIDNTSKAVSMVQTAEGALNEVNSLLLKIRSLALDSANSGVNDANAQAANQSEVANAIATIDRIALNSQFGTKKILDGSAGITGTTDDADVTFLKAANDSPTGTFAVNITAAATRANITAGTTQTGPLATD